MSHENAIAPSMQPAGFDILLVGGDAAEAATLTDWLIADARARVTHAPDADACSHLLPTRRWDLVVAHANLRGFHDSTIAATLRRRCALLLLVADARDDALLHALRHGADGVLRSPPAREEFVARAIELAGEAQAARLRTHKRVLAIGAHPDDVEIGCGGTLAKHRAAGDELMILTLSHGAQGGEAKQRGDEARRAAAMLDAILDLHDLPDAAISEGVETIRIIESAVRAFASTHVYTHSRQDTHQDHRAVHAASLVATRGVANLYGYQSPSSTVEFRPQRFVDISAQIDDKLRLIRAHASQAERRANIQPDLIVATARYWGRHAGHVLAEPMVVLRQSD